MNSKKGLARLGRKKSHRVSLKKNLLTSLVIYEHVKTTRARAKAVVPMFDKLISVAKQDERHARKEISKMLFDEGAVNKVMEVLVDRFKDETGGLIKTYKVGNRPGDNADMVQMFVKGYVYKDIGKPVKGAKKTETSKQEKKTQNFGSESRNKVSQVQATNTQTKAKSRSGI